MYQYIGVRDLSQVGLTCQRNSDAHSGVESWHVSRACPYCAKIWVSQR